MSAFAVSIDVLITCPAGGSKAVAGAADSVLREFARQKGASRTDLAGSPATGEYTFVVVVNDDEGDRAAVQAATLLRSAASSAEVATPSWPCPDELHVRNVRVQEIVAA